MAKIKKTSKEISKSKGSPFKDYWNKKNYLFLYIGVGLLLFGFFLMSKGQWDDTLSLTISPIVLLLAFILIIPLSILLKLSKKKTKEPNVPRES